MTYFANQAAIISIFVKLNYNVLSMLFRRFKEFYDLDTQVKDLFMTSSLPPLPAKVMKVCLYCIVLYCIVFYCIVLYCVVLYCIVLYCIVLMISYEKQRSSPGILCFYSIADVCKSSRYFICQSKKSSIKQLCCCYF